MDFKRFLLCAKVVGCAGPYAFCSQKQGEIEHVFGRLKQG